MTKVLVASDLHLSDTIWKHRPIFGDSYYAWSQIVDIALKNKVQAVILAGDLLDKQYNPSNPVHSLISGVRVLNQANIAVLFNQGQHEMMDTPWIKLGTKTIWLHNKQVQLEGKTQSFTLVGCDYQDRTKFQEFLKSDLAKEADILVCHQVWQDFMGEVGKPQAAFADVPENVKLLITGDYHDAIITKHNKLTVISPGSTHMRSISEPENKSVVLMTLGESEKQPIQLKQIPLQSRPCIRLDLTKPSFSSKQVISYLTNWKHTVDLPEEIQTPLLFVQYNEETRKFFDTHIVSLVNFHLFSKFKRENGEEIFTADEANTDKVSLLQMLSKIFKEDTKEYDLAVKLLQAGDAPELVLENWLKDQITDVHSETETE